MTLEELHAAESKIAQTSLDDLDAQLPELCERFQRHVDALDQWFVARRDVIRAALLCATLGEPLLLLGPPGTAKSQLCARLAESLHLGPELRFEYLLTPFTEPSELLGPVDLSALREGRFIRKHTGMLTHAKVAFLDEIFRANSAILNTLLALFNERVYYEEGRAHSAPLSVIFAAANELPAERHLAALSDRFVLKVPVDHIHQTHWDELLDRGVSGMGYAAEGLQPWRDGPASYLDLLKLRRYLALSLMHEARDPDLRDHFFPPALMAEWRQLMTALELDLGIYVSDRKIVRLYRLLRCAALLEGRSAVQRRDLLWLRFLAQRPGEYELLTERIERALDLDV